MATVEKVPFFTEDYGQRLEALETALDLARKDAARGQGDGAPRTMLEADPVAELEEQLDALYAEALSKATVVTLAPVKRDAWRKLKEAHPPRKGDDVPEDDRKADASQGFNVSTIDDDLVYACVVEPEFKSRAAFDEWAGELAAGEWQTLVNTAWEITVGVRSVPKDRLSRMANGG